ncbi:MAG: dephospho-CoA kinase [Chthonomonadales bacterium]|nr:dephospho-CoA kinase [Chthonomonadales bacterium]
MRLIGITGGVATGKSEVARLFAQRGAIVLSADAIAREATAPGSPLIEAIARDLGAQYVRDGVLDRAALAELVFRDPEARGRLEAIVHPVVLKRLRDAVEELRNRTPKPEVVTVEVPLLYEVGIEGWFDEVVVVAAPQSEQLRRLQNRDGLAEEAALARIRAQMPIEEKMARADHVIVNDGTIGDLARSVEEIWQNKLSRSGV